MTSPLRLGIGQGHGGATVVTGARTFAAALSARTGRAVRIVVAEDYAALQRATLAGAIDLGWHPPFLHIEATAAGATLAAVCEREGALTYRSALLVRADSPIRDLDDLARARVAWTDRQSASGYVFPRLHLLANGIDPARAFASEAFLGSPRAACSAVADGDVDLCACFTSEAHAGSVADTLTDVARIYPAAPWRLRVLAVTESVPCDGIVVAAQVERDETARIAEALLAFHTFPEGKAALSQLLFADRLVAVSEEVARVIARLRTLMPR
jgi:phosphonate transport system substrate-binding protein